MTGIKKCKLKTTLLRVASVALLGCMCFGNTSMEVKAVGASKTTRNGTPKKSKASRSRLPIRESNHSRLLQSRGPVTPLGKEKTTRLTPDFIIKNKEKLIRLTPDFIIKNKEFLSAFRKNPRSFSAAYSGPFFWSPAELKYEGQAVKAPNNNLPKPDPACFDVIERELKEHPESFWYLDESRPSCIRNLLPEFNDCN